MIKHQANVKWFLKRKYPEKLTLLEMESFPISKEKVIAKLRSVCLYY